MVIAPPAPVHDPLDALLRGGANPSVGRMPLVGMEVGVDIRGGVAIVRVSRHFRNSEDVAIEATLTFPVPFDAFLTDLCVEIDGRKLVAKAQPRVHAREIYEDGIARGKLAVLHEECLRGIHMLSVGQIGAGKAVTVVSTYVTSLSFSGRLPGLRIPMTVGELYGRSPLPPSDDLETSADVVHRGVLSVSCDTGHPVVGGGLVADGRTPFSLNQPIDIAIESWSPRPAHGVIADGRRIQVDVSAAGSGELALNLALLVDTSGSTGGMLDATDITVNGAIRRDLPAILARDLSERDEVALWEFGSTPLRIGRARGAAAVAALARAIRHPQGGTELGAAVNAAIAGDDLRDILIVTDGQTHAAEVSALAASGRRISVILVGDHALEGRVGDLAGATGGQIFVVRGADVGEALRAAIGSLRRGARPVAPGSGVRIPDRFDVVRGGARIVVDAVGAGSVGQPDSIGRFIAALSLPALGEEAQVATSIAHGLVNQHASLVVIDEAGETQDGLPEFRKVPLMAAETVMHSYQPSAYIEMPMMALPIMADAASTSASQSRLSVEFDAPLQAPDGVWSKFSRATAAMRGGGRRRGGPASPKAALDARLDALKGRIDWATLTPALMKGDLTGLAEDVRDTILALAATTEVLDMKQRGGGESAVRIVLRLLAEREAASNRYAARFARAAARGGQE